MESIEDSGKEMVTLQPQQELSGIKELITHSTNQRSALTER